MTKIDYQTAIKTTEPCEVVFVDRYDEDTVWLSIQIRGGSARCTLTKDQAKDMIAALIRVVDAE